MQQMDHKSEEARGLWRDARAAFAQPVPEGGGAAPDPLLVAAWLDGRLAEPERDAFEARLAADSAALELLLAADAALGATAPLPEPLLARAAALVAGEDLDSARPGLLRRLFGGGAAGTGTEIFRLRPLALAATLAAILVVSVAGFELGKFGYAVASEAIETQVAGFGLTTDGEF